MVRHGEQHGGVERVRHLLVDVELQGDARRGGGLGEPSGVAEEHLVAAHGQQERREAAEVAVEG
nr:hypothetical protein [Pseudonocardia nigra]